MFSTYKFFISADVSTPISGNVRVVVNERDSVEQVSHYYPFGGSFGDGVGSSVQDYLYSGKELTRFNALNWYNYGARWYDPTIARWNGVDNMAENYLGCSPYIYCGNNPISRIDVDGNDWYITGSGNIVYNPSVHSQRRYRLKRSRKRIQVFRGELER